MATRPACLGHAQKEFTLTTKATSEKKQYKISRQTVYIVLTTTYDLLRYDDKRHVIGRLYYASCRDLPRHGTSITLENSGKEKWGTECIRDENFIIIFRTSYENEMGVKNTPFGMKMGVKKLL